MATIAENVTNVFRRIEAACKRVNRKIEDVALVCVTKDRTHAEIDEAIQAGITMIGENRVQEAEEKFPRLRRVVQKHFLGRIQRNKIKNIVALFDVVQSVDRLEVAEKLNEAALDQGKILPIFIQVNIDRDPAKAGVLPEKVHEIFMKMQKLPALNIEGLMTIGQLTKNPEEARQTFRNMKKLVETLHTFDGLAGRLLSMGMSDDFEIAIEEGATMIRVGRAIFS